MRNAEEQLQRQFAQLAVESTNRELAQRTSASRSPENEEGQDSNEPGFGWKLVEYGLTAGIVAGFGFFLRRAINSEF